MESPKQTLMRDACLPKSRHLLQVIDAAAGATAYVARIGGDELPFATGNVGLEESSAAIFERVEVIRGATGLLQGAGEPSASINMVRKRADARDFAGEVTLEGGSWDRFSGIVDVGTPLTTGCSIALAMLLIVLPTSIASLAAWLMTSVAGAELEFDEDG